MKLYDATVYVALEAEDLTKAVEGLARAMEELNVLVGVWVTGVGGLDEREPEQGQ